MPIERVLNLPFPSDLTDISSVQEYLQRLYVALTENSYLLVEDIQREANPDASYVVVSSNDNLTNERVLTAGNGITLSDGGAGGNMAVAVDSNDVFLLDQTTPQTVVNGIPLLDQEHDDFSKLKEFVNKDYVDWAATAIGANYYMTDDTDSDTGYKICSLTPSADSETYIEVSGITDDQLLGTWISDVGEAPTKLLRGIFDWFIFAEKTSGTKTLRLYWKLYERKTDDSEVLVATSSESNELDTGVKTSYIVPLTLDSDYTPDSGSRIVGKIYASVSGSGNAPTVKIYYQGVSGSRWEIPSSTEILDSIYVKQADHTKAAHDALGIDAETTDGYHLDQDVRTTASPTFDDLTLSSPSNIYNLSHDSFADFVANEHIDHTSVTLTAGTGLTGGGDISANRTFNVDVGIADNKILQVDQAAGLTTGNLVRATSSGLESRTDAEILAQLSGKASSVFDWNGQDLTNIADLSAKTIAIVPGSTSDIPASFQSLQSTAPLGSELVTNGTFDSDLSGWTIGGTGSGWTWDSGKAKHNTGNTDTLSQDISVTDGTTYQVEITISGRTAGSIIVDVGGVYIYSYGSDKNLNSNTTYKRTLVASGTGSQVLTITPTSNFDGAIDNVTVKAITSTAQAAFAARDDDGSIVIEGRGDTGLSNLAFGRDALRSNTTGSSNSVFGLNALRSNTTGSSNSAFGRDALRSNTTGSSNSAFGQDALLSNTAGSFNSAFGRDALRSNTTGSFNSAFGLNALYYNTTGFSNSTFGRDALLSNTAGSSNSAFGRDALRSNTTGSSNSAFGRDALRSNTTGSSNSVFGLNALYYNTTGFSNSAFGWDALLYNQEGDGNVGIGYKAGRGTTIHDKNYNVLIGYQAGRDLNAVNHKLVIANDYTDARTLIHGDFSTKTLFTKAPTSAPVDGDFHASDICFYLDEVNHKLKVKVKYSDGTTIKTGEVALS